MRTVKPQARKRLTALFAANPPEDSRRDENQGCGQNRQALDEIAAYLIQKETIKALVENVSACDEVWAVSRGAGENLRSLGFEGDYHVMTNGVDFPKGMASQALVDQATAQFDLPAGVPIFLFVGRIMNYKGLPLIIDALKMLSDTGRDFRMVFVGSGPDAELLKEQALSCDFAVDFVSPVSEDGTTFRPDADEDRDFFLKDGKTVMLRHLNCGTMRKGKIIFAGAERDRGLLRAWNTRADLFLFPSTFDTNGLVVREAAACGLASVLIKDSCAAEGITDGRNGFVIPEKASALAALLGELCRHPDKLKEAGLHAMEEIYIGWESCVKEAHDRYALLLEKKANGLLPKRKWDATEVFLRAAGEATLTFYDAFNTRREILEGMEENQTRMIRAGENARRNWEEFASETRKTIEELRTEARRSMTEIRENAKKEILGLRDDAERDFEEWKKY